jgi:hypothetical protein
MRHRSRTLRFKRRATAVIGRRRLVDRIGRIVREEIARRGACRGATRAFDAIATPAATASTTATATTATTRLIPAVRPCAVLILLRGWCAVCVFHLNALIDRLVMLGVCR